MVYLYTAVGVEESVVEQAVRADLDVVDVRDRLEIVSDSDPTEARREVPVAGGPYLRAKYLIDRTLGAVLLVVFAPLMAVVALGIRVKLGRGVIFSQRRVGLGSKVFVMYKFRTMRHDRRERAVAVDVDRRKTHKTSDDPRHTRFGRFLRKTSLDELPQLVNVVRGEMSLVGPRPELEVIVAEHDLWEHRRHSVKPGITGLWQVSEHRKDLLHENLHVDLDYLDEVSLTTDLKIIARTAGALFLSTGR